jgi:hypothetical protein
VVWRRGGGGKTFARQLAEIVTWLIWSQDCSFISMWIDRRLEEGYPLGGGGGERKKDMKQRATLTEVYPIILHHLLPLYKILVNGHQWGSGALRQTTECHILMCIDESLKVKSAHHHNAGK